VSHSLSPLSASLKIDISSIRPSFCSLSPSPFFYVNIRTSLSEHISFGCGGIVLLPTSPMTKNHTNLRIHTISCFEIMSIINVNRFQGNVMLRWLLVTSSLYICTIVSIFSPFPSHENHVA
jgi:hypothetical protein